MDECVRLDDVGKQFGGQWVFRHVSLTLPTRQTTAIVGPSGCGKTTLLQLINGLVRLDEGDLNVLNAPIPETDLPAFRRKIGYAVQGAGLFPHLTVQQNIDLTARLEGWSESKIRNRVAGLFELMGMDWALGARYPYQLSGGQQQRVGLCRAMMLQPPLLLLDEPFSAIDPITREEIYGHFEALQQQENVSALLVTHDLREAVRLAQFLVFMGDGHILQYGETAAVLESPATESIRRLIETQL